MRDERVALDAGEVGFNGRPRFEALTERPDGGTRPAVWYPNPPTRLFVGSEGKVLPSHNRAWQNITRKGPISLTGS